MILSVHQPQYLPWLGYFHKMAISDVFVYLDDVQYKKREFQNRNRIRTNTPNAYMWLTVPVKVKDRFTQKICEVEINNDYPWRRKHWKSIELHYRGAKYFSQYAGFFEALYGKVWLKLIDINLEIIDFFVRVFNIKTKIFFSSSLSPEGEATDRIISLCKILSADTYLSGIGGKQYLEEEKFAKNNIKLVYQDFKHPVYKQVYEPFVPNMSAVDFLFNCGAEEFSEVL
jgi:hypothetical protein